MRHGNYRALEVLYHTFLPDEFSIARKSYGDPSIGQKPSSAKFFSQDRQKKFDALLKLATKVKHSYGIQYHLPAVAA